jgi:cytochrome c
MNIKVQLTVLAAICTLATSTQAAEGDAANGENVFKKCKICHQIGEGAKNQVGPQLNGIVGRKAASVEGFAMYSQALKGYNVTWNAKTLDEFLENPMGKVPGTMMVMPVTDAKERADLIGFLATLKGK